MLSIESSMKKYFVLIALSIGVTTQAQTPKTVMDFFMALPEKYFAIECCHHSKQEYIKMYLETNDTKNAYLKAGADGAQNAIEMTLFKKASGNFVAVVATSGEEGMHTDFVEYNNGKWVDAASKLLPIKKDNYVYELLRKGTNIKVYNIKTEEWGIEKGKFAFNLYWNKEKFVQ